MKFAANLGFLYVNETDSITERYIKAKEAGFCGVETPDPYRVPLKQLQEIKDSLKIYQIQINSYQGDPNKGEFGFACLPDKLLEFKEYLELSINYAKGLNCNKIHILSGLANKNFDLNELETTYISNLKYSAERLAKEGITCLIEPINNRSVPHYFFNNFNLARRVLDSVADPNLKLQFDFFHAQIINGDLTCLFKAFQKEIGHIQIAQVPDRGSPRTLGEINYDYILDFLKKSGYDGWIGLEYKPLNENTDDIFQWLKKWL